MRKCEAIRWLKWEEALVSYRGMMWSYNILHDMDSASRGCVVWDEVIVHDWMFPQDFQKPSLSFNLMMSPHTFFFFLNSSGKVVTE